MESYLAIQVVMMPRDTNPYGTIFGGVILSYLDQAGAIGARREVGRLGGPLPFLVTPWFLVETKKSESTN